MTQVPILHLPDAGSQHADAAGTGPAHSAKHNHLNAHPSNLPNINTSTHRRRRRSRGNSNNRALQSNVGVSVLKKMVDGSGNPIDCGAVLSDGPPVYGEPAAGDDNGEDDGRDTNGSFDESVLLYQLCLEQEGDSANKDDAAGNAGPASGGTGVNPAAPNGGAFDDYEFKPSTGGTSARPRLKYLCPPYDDPASERKPRGKFLSYSYDVHVLETTHVLDATAAYEAAMVSYLARRLDLDGCAGGASVRRHLLRRSLQQDGAGGEKVRYDYEDEVPVVVGISAEPRDMPNYDAVCNEHYLGVPTKCYHMNGSLALYFRSDAPADVVQEEAEDVLRLISRGMVEDKFRTDAIPIAVFVEGGVMGDGSTIIGGGNTNSNNAGGSPVLPEVDGSGGSIFAPSDPLVVSANASDTGSGGGGSGGDGGGGSSAAIAGVGAAIAVLALAVVLVLFVRRRRRNLANKYSLREVGTAPLEDGSPEVQADGVVIVDKSKSHRKTGSRNFSEGTYCDSPTLPNTPSSFEDPDDDGGYQEAVELGLTEEAAAATAAIAEAAARTAQHQHRRTNSNNSHGSGYYTAAQSVQKSRSHGSNTTVGADNLVPIQQQRGGGTAAEDDTNSVGSDESGVTIDLDMNRVNSTISEITWAGPQARREASAAANILSRFPPYKSLYSGSNPGAIVEEEDDFDENDEDPIADGGGSAASQRSTGGSTDFGSGRRRM